MWVNFSPYVNGLSALQASQIGLNITGQNVANVNTPGYNDQSVIFSPDAPPIGQSFRGGVTVQQIQSSISTA